MVWVIVIGGVLLWLLIITIFLGMCQSGHREDEAMQDYFDRKVKR